jgi:hypothetical protein
MKKTACVVIGACVVASCLDVDNRPVLSMVANANHLTLTTQDTLVISRGITNGGREDMWLHVSADAFEMTASNGSRVCDASMVLALISTQVVRVPSGQGIADERRFPMSQLTNCEPGTYSLIFVGHFRETEAADDSFTLRTSPTTFQLNAP